MDFSPFGILFNIFFSTVNRWWTQHRNLSNSFSSNSRSSHIISNLSVNCKQNYPNRLNTNLEKMDRVFWLFEITYCWSFIRISWLLSGQLLLPLHYDSSYFVLIYICMERRFQISNFRKNYCRVRRSCISDTLLSF